MLASEENINTLAFLNYSLDKSFKVYYKRLSLAKHVFCEVTIHNLRISMRKVITICDLIERLLPNKYCEELIIFFKDKLKSLNKLRDCQVQILKYGGLLKQGRFLPIYLDYLYDNEEKQLIKIKQQFNSFFDESASDLFFFLRLNLRNMSLLKNNISKQLKEYINDSYLSILEIAGRLSNECRGETTTNSGIYEEYHNLRLIFKEYRYTSELIISYLKKKTIVVKRMKNIQDMLGEVQDYSVFINRTQKYMQKAIPELQLSLIKVVRQLESERLALVLKISSDRKYFNSVNTVKFINKLCLNEGN